MDTFKNKNYQTYLFALLLMSGTLKPFILTYIGQQIDFTLIMAIVVMIDIIISKSHFNVYSLKPIFVIILFSFYLIFSMGYSSSTLYLYDKFQGYILSLVYFVYPFFIKRINIKLFIRTYSIILIPLILFFIRMKSILWIENSIDTEVFMDLRSNYLSLALHLGILIIILNYYRKNIYYQLFCVGLLFATSARGPFLFVLLVLFLMNAKKVKSIILNWLTSFRSIVVMILLFVVLFYMWDIIYIYLEGAFMRYSSIGSDDNSLEARNHFMDFAFYTPFEKLHHFIFGSGFASFGYDFFGEDIRAYPHNMILEIFYEMGIVGVFIFSVFLFYIFYKAYINNAIFYFILIFIILNSLKSYSLADSWVLFAMFGCILREFDFNKVNNNT